MFVQQKATNWETKSEKKGVVLFDCHYVAKTMRTIDCYYIINYCCIKEHIILSPSALICWYNNHLLGWHMSCCSIYGCMKMCFWCSLLHWRASMQSHPLHRYSQMKLWPRSLSPTACTSCFCFYSTTPSLQNMSTTSPLIILMTLTYLSHSGIQCLVYSSKLTIFILHTASFPFFLSHPAAGLWHSFLASWTCCRGFLQIW